MASNTESSGLLSRVSSLLRPATRNGPRARSASIRSALGSPTDNMNASRRGTVNGPYDEKNSDGAGASSSSGALSALQSEKDQKAAEDEEFMAAHDRVRTLPPWIHSLTADESTDTVDPNSTLLPRPPAWARPPHRNFHPVQGSDPTYPHASRWRIFAEASQYARPAGEISTVVDEEWCQKNLPDMDSPWNPEGMADGSDDDSLGPGMWLFHPGKRLATIHHWQALMLNNPFVPLVIRLVVLTFVVAALALGASIFRNSNTLNNNPQALQSIMTVPGSDDEAICKQQPSTYMAFIVSSVAVPYLAFITQDEYFSKPLGLRSSKAKMRLLFLDLFFIVFSAANLALAFNTLTDQQWACFEGDPLSSNSLNTQAAQSTCVQNDGLCRRQRALVGILFIVLTAWVLTFALSTMRVVERISK